MRSIALAALVALLGAAPGASPSPVPVAASTTSPIDLARNRVDTMLRTGHADASWFADSFLAQVSATQVDDVIATLTKTLGAYASLDVTPEKFVAHFANGTDDILIHLDAQSKIDQLLFKPPAVGGSSLDGALRKLASPGATLSYVIEEGGSDVAALDPSQALAVGSAFKVAVLNGLLDQIRGGRRHWSDAVPLRDAWKSLPSGVLQRWPTGTPVTIATYAAEMISISDNTAADALVRLVGPAGLAPYAGGNEPFLTTREMFTLKSDGGAPLRARYLAATTSSQRAAVLRSVDALPLPSLRTLKASPDLAIEWHYSVRRLCALMHRVAALPLMTINPGINLGDLFRRVAYKGGSDGGIINMTTMVTTKRGAQICFSATLNDAAKAIDETAFEFVYASTLRLLATR